MRSRRPAWGPRIRPRQGPERAVACTGDRAVHDPPAVPRPRHRSRAPRAPRAAGGGRGGDRRRPGSATRSCTSSRGRRPSAEVARVHPAPFLDRLAEFTLGGGGHIDPDTVAVPASYAAALLAAGAGLEPPSTTSMPARATWRSAPSARPGHHATATPVDGLLPGQQRGRHGPGAGRPRRAGAHRRLRRPPRQRHPGRLLRRSVASSTCRSTSTRSTRAPVACPRWATATATATTVNFPFPAGATGDVYRAALDAVVVPLVERWQPTWLLVSAGFDGHRRDPDHRARAERPVTSPT